MSTATVTNTRLLTEHRTWDDQIAMLNAVKGLWPTWLVESTLVERPHPQYPSLTEPFFVFKQPVERLAVYSTLSELKHQHEVRERTALAEAIQVGDGITKLCYSDQQAFTVIEKKGKKIKVQRDKATRLTQPEFIPVGFSAHCTNQRQIEWSYETNPTGEVLELSLRKDGYYKTKGGNGDQFILGRHEFYDYNFLGVRYS